MPEKPDNATLLKIYALYKQATERRRRGQAPRLHRPRRTRQVGRPGNGIKGKSADDAMQEYVDLIESLK